MNSQHVALELRIKPGKERYAIGESIYIEVTIKNLSPEIVLIRQYLLFPSDDPRNNIIFKITDNRGQQIKRKSHTLTGRSLVQPWRMLEELETTQSYIQRFQLAGTYKRRIKRKTSMKPLWSLGENPEITLINEYPVQQKGKYKITVIYHNTDDGRNWPQQFWDRKQKVWTGELVSNKIEIEVFE